MIRTSLLCGMFEPLTVDTLTPQVDKARNCKTLRMIENRYSLVVVVELKKSIVVVNASSVYGKG